MNNDAILIIDDNPADIILAKKAIAISRPGCVITIAENGRQAIELLQRGELPSLVFLDYKMPGLTGIDVLSTIRTCEATRYVPVVMLSSSNYGGDMRDAYNAGANSYLNKTFDFGLFTEEINTVLHYWLDLNRSPAKVS
jgi:CheY-like chemotaxis protein